MDRYKNLPVFVLTNSQNKDFRATLARNGATKLLDKTTASPKRLTEEINALENMTGTGSGGRLRLKVIKTLSTIPVCSAQS
jgi:CheY-like chemotaxis protein